jgi:GNAT superfamily N-acetyltransferase
MASIDIPDVRMATEEDARALAALAAELGYPTTDSEMGRRLARIIADRRYAVFVAGDRETVGWIQTCLTESLEGGTFAEILGLVVTQNQRRTGIGARLVSRAEDWARENGCFRVRVRTNVVRAEAPAFYAKLGYKSKKRQEVFEKTLP